MTRVPTRQLYPPTSTTHLQLFRYSSSNPLKTPFLSKGFCSESKLNKNPFRKPNSLLKIKCSGGGLSHLKIPNLVSTSSSTTWLGKWNQINKNNSPKTPRAARDYRENESDFDNDNGFDSGTGTVRVSGGSTMERIVEKLKKFGYVDEMNVSENVSENESGNERKTKRKNEARVIEKGSVEDIFFVEDGLLPNPRGGFSRESPLGVERLFGDEREVRFPWEKGGEKIDEKFSVREKSRTNMAELTLPESELRRLRNLAHGIKSKMRVKGGGVTHTVVEMIHEKWKSAEVVKLKIEGAPALNMKRVHEILERKTGGLVIWRSGTSVSLYRGVGFESPSEQAGKNKLNNMAKVTKRPKNVESVPKRYLESGEEIEEIEPGKVVSYEDEVDKLLDGLGERYTDWPGGEPLPVDADLLPGIVAGYQPPFRILPYGVRGTLSVKEATDLRRLARVLPPHFALGRSRQHQGLAVAMIKLWERSSIAKIAIKRGVQLTTSERMAEDIKKLTGGMLLSRNKDFLVFYRGKNFLSPEVSEALLEKERLAKSLQDEEEQARLRASASIVPNSWNTTDSQRAGTLEETLEANARWAKTLDHNDKVKVLREADVLRHANLVRKLESKLAFADRKLMKAQRNLSKVEESLSPVDRQSDPDSISDEERFMFRKLGLRMKAFLLLGRRGVFGGTVENMHLHWKYRELVKIIVKAANFEEVKNIALSLESESGGVLVSVDRVSKGYAIIVYRGRDYHRPSALRPKNLLTKRKALARSIELQRSEDLHNHISALETRVAKLRREIDQMSTMRGTGNVELYDELDSAYSTEDDDSEEEENEGYDDPDSDGEEENDHMIHNTDHLETSFVYDLHDQELEEPGDCSTYVSVNES